MKTNKLELLWVGKKDFPNVEPRVLIEDLSSSYKSIKDEFNNILIFGDNLLALKALEHTHSNSIKCIYIDPPYNTFSAIAEYDDGVEHSIWLSLIRDRLEILKKLLSQDGSIWISIDDHECHYLKVLLDELFGRKNFVTSIVWQKNYAPADHSVEISESHEYILVYAKNREAWKANRLPRNDEVDSKYKNPDKDPRGPWKPGDYTCNKTAKERPNLYYPVIHPITKKEIWPKKTRVWAYGKEQHLENVRNKQIWWGAKGENSVPSYKRFLTSVEGSGIVPQTVWTWDEVGHTQDGKKDQMALFPNNPFPTPKPETLIHRIIEIASSPGDLILDSFAGSGTTGAVAQKMGRRWIMVELGDHCHTHIIPRMKKVIDGKDPGGVTTLTKWKGGGSYRYFSLAPSLLEKDPWGNWVISKAYNSALLAEALCKLHGFTYEPSRDRYWMQGRSSETDFIYVTTQTLTQAQLRALSDDVGDHRSLLVCCAAFKGDVGAYPNLTLKKIPHSVLAKCEWGKDDYSLNIRNLPSASDLGLEPMSIPTKQTVLTKPAKKDVIADGSPRQQQTGGYKGGKKVKP